MIACRVQIIENRWNTVVIATDLSDCEYSSITLHTEELATSLCDSFGIDHRRLLWIEHIPKDHRLGRNDDLYDLVHFDEQGATLSRPIWTPLTPEEVAVLSGQVIRTAEEYR